MQLVSENRLRVEDGSLEPSAVMQLSSPWALDRVARWGAWSSSIGARRNDLTAMRFSDRVCLLVSSNKQISSSHLHVICFCLIV